MSAIRDTLDRLLEPKTIAELRMLKTRKRTVSGYYNDLDMLTKDVEKWDGDAPNIYVTLNPVHPDLLARAVNRIREFCLDGDTTSDKDIVRRRWLLIDADAVRASGISATDAEHDLALARAWDIADYLKGIGWPAPIRADSGNGGHLLYRINRPNDDETTDLLRRCLQALDLKFSDSEVSVDVGNYNAARITKLYGTMACKGDSTPERPHRRSQILEVPDRLDVAKLPMLERLAKTLPAAPPRGNKSYGDFDLDRWIVENNLPVAREGSWDRNGRKYILNPCVWNPDHDNYAAFIVQHASGAIAAGCHHNGCAGLGWPEMRELFEPGYRNGHTPTGEPPTNGDKPQAGPIVIRVADVQPEEVQWTAYGWLALGRCTVLMGDPGVGKSYVTLAITTAVTLGKPLIPGEKTTAEPSKVLMLCAEDGLADTVRPRLDAMGADVTRAFVLQAVRDDKGTERHFSLVNDLPKLEEELAKGGYSLIIIDPINNYLGSDLDTHRDAALRSVLAPLATLAERWKVAVLFTQHLTKSKRDRALYRGQGSIAYSGLARVVLLAGQNPDDPKDRAVAWVKGNLTEPMPAVGYEIRDGQFYWRGESDLSAERMLMPDSSARESAQAEAENFLREVLADGPVDADIVKDQAAGLDISLRTLNRAKKALRVKSERRGEAGKQGGGTWVWELPGIKVAKQSLGNVNPAGTRDSHVNDVVDEVGNVNPVGNLNNGLKPASSPLVSRALELGLKVSETAQ